MGHHTARPSAWGTEINVRPASERHRATRFGMRLEQHSTTSDHGHRSGGSGDGVLGRAAARGPVDLVRRLEVGDTTGANAANDTLVERLRLVHGAPVHTYVDNVRLGGGHRRVVLDHRVGHIVGNLAHTAALGTSRVLADKVAHQRGDCYGQLRTASTYGCRGAPWSSCTCSQSGARWARTEPSTRRSTSWHPSCPRPESSRPGRRWARPTTQRRPSTKREPQQRTRPPGQRHRQRRQQEEQGGC